MHLEQVLKYVDICKLVVELLITLKINNFMGISSKQLLMSKTPV